MVHHLWGAFLRIYSYIYDLLGLGALVNLVFKAVVSRQCHPTTHSSLQHPWAIDCCGC